MSSPNYTYSNSGEEASKKRKYSDISQPDTPSMDEDYDPVDQYADQYSDDVWDTPSGSEEEYTLEERLEGLIQSHSYAFRLITQLTQKMDLLTRMVTLNTNYCNDTSLKTWNNQPPPPSPSALMTHDCRMHSN